MVKEQRRRSLREALDDLDRYAGMYDLKRMEGDRDAQRLVMHAMYVAIQACVDEAAEICREAGLDCGSTYREVFTQLGRSGVLDSSLAGRMAIWASMRNVLAHFYPVLDMRRVHEALEDRQDLKEFAAWLETRDPP
jgi:uncharacterized protein YutE (UPF0331/DUF86 family)